MASRDRRPRFRRDGARGRRLRRRNDRPLRGRSTQPAIRGGPVGGSPGSAPGAKRYLMDLFRQFRDEVLRQVDDLVVAGTLPAGLDTVRVAVEPPRDIAHGDLSPNAAMVLAKPDGRTPRELAALLAERPAGVAGVSVAGVRGPVWRGR